MNIYPTAGDYIPSQTPSIFPILDYVQKLDVDFADLKYFFVGKHDVVGVPDTTQILNSKDGVNCAHTQP